MSILPGRPSSKTAAYSDARCRYEERELALVRWCKKVVTVSGTRDVGNRDDLEDLKIDPTVPKKPRSE
jgi:hypothetical protein